MPLSQIITLVQLASAVLLTASILLQRRGAGLSGTFGGSSGGGYYARRGVEKALFIATIIFAVIFLASSVARILL